jgi:hypothetical protein
MTRVRLKAIHDKVNSILSVVDLNTHLNGILPHAHIRYVIRCKRQQGPIEEELQWCKEERRRKEKRREEERRRKEKRREGKKKERRRKGRGGGASGQGGPVPPAMGGRHLQLESRRLPQALPRVCLRPVLPAMHGRYYRPWPSGTSALGTGQGTAWGSEYPGRFGHLLVFFRYHGWYLRPRYRSAENSPDLNRSI